MVCVCKIASVVSNSLQCYRLEPTRLLCPWDSIGNDTRVGSHSLLQGNLPNPGLPHCIKILLPPEPLGKPQGFLSHSHYRCPQSMPPPVLSSS